DEKRRRELDPKLLDQVGTPVDVDAQELEGLVVPASLQDLGEKAFDAARAARGRRVEEDELRPLPRCFGFLRRPRFEGRHRATVRSLVAALRGSRRTAVSALRPIFSTTT